MEIDKELLKGSIAIIVLRIISNHDSYGYEIIKEIDDASNGRLSFKEGTLYPILHALEKEKLIESYWENSDVGRKRKYYRLTNEGESDLIRKMNDFQYFVDTVNMILGERGGNDELYNWISQV